MDAFRKQPNMQCTFAKLHQVTVNIPKSSGIPKKQKLYSWTTKKIAPVLQHPFYASPRGVHSDVFQVMKVEALQLAVDRYHGKLKPPELFGHGTNAILNIRLGHTYLKKNRKPTSWVGNQMIFFCDIGDYLCHLAGLPRGRTSYIHMCQGRQ